MTRRIGAKRSHRVLKDVLRGEDLGTIAERYRMTRRTLAQWMCEPEIAEQLGAMSRAADLQVESCVSQYRMLAATRLVELASATECKRGDETIRRACNDVLRPRIGDGRKRSDTEEELLTPAQIIAEIEAATAQGRREADSQT